MKGINKTETTDLGFLQSLFGRIRKAKNTDGNIGIKMPVYLHRNGLKNVQARTSDCVKVLLDSTQNIDLKEQLIESFENDGLGLQYTDEVYKSKIDYFVSLGFTKEESEKYLEKEMKMNKYFSSIKNELNMTYSAAMTFSFGEVEK